MVLPAALELPMEIYSVSSQSAHIHILPASFQLLHNAKLSTTRKEPQRRSSVREIWPIWQFVEDMKKGTQSVPVRAIVNYDHVPVEYQLRIWRRLLNPLPRIWTRWISSAQHRALAATLRRASTKEMVLSRSAWKIRKGSRTKREGKKRKCQGIVNSLTCGSPVVTFAMHLAPLLFNSSFQTPCS